MLKKPAPVILRNAAADVPEFYFYEEFGPDDCGLISANGVRDALRQITSKKLNIHFNTAGGDVFEALAIYNLLKNSGLKITCLIDGQAISSGSWVAQVGDNVIMAENAMIMVHDPETACFGNQADMLRNANLLGQAKASILSMYASRNQKLTADQISAAMSAETWYTAQEALDNGFVDTIDPNKSSVNRIDVVNRFRNAPQWVKDLGTTNDEWRRVMNQRRQLLNELEGF